MTPSILLLDCSSSLTEKLKRQGFDVNSGTIGFCNSVRSLPCQVYEKEVFVYDPHYFASDENGYISSSDINDITPDYNLKPSDLFKHIYRGAIFLIFINRLVSDLKKQNEAYNWIPFMPEIFFTKDHKPITNDISKYHKYSYLSPLLVKDDLKIPILQKINLSSIESYKGLLEIEIENTPLFSNRNSELLGVFLNIGKGGAIILPEYKSNEEIIATFLNRVIPRIYKTQSKVNLIDLFLSTEEKIIKEEIQKLENERKILDESSESAKENLATATRIKIQTIESDDTANLVVKYYDNALQQDDVALFYLYKIIEVLEKKYGSEKEAKNILGCNTEWNLIGKVANASYGDMRHAPKPGEKIKEWNPEEIKPCFEGAKKIIHEYLKTLF